MTRRPLATAFPVAALILAAGLLAGPVWAQGTFKRGFYEDPAKGFKVKVPAKWGQVPTQVDEKWIVAQFQSNREYEGHHKLDASYTHKPKWDTLELDNGFTKNEQFQRVESQDRPSSKSTSVAFPIVSIIVVLGISGAAGN